MNLLELMLKDKVEWPVGAEFAAQDGDMWFACYDGTAAPFMYDQAMAWSSEGSLIQKAIRKLCSLSDDWSTRIITREEYQSAGGWMKWEGGECPVNGILVKYRMRNSPSLHSEGEAENLRWSHDRHGDGTESDGDIISYRIIKQTESGFEPFVSVEDAHEYKDEHAITPSKYTKQIHGVSVDVYDVLMAWGVINPALQHLIKKALQCGQRGHKDKQQDLQDIIDSAIRAKELEQDA